MVIALLITSLLNIAIIQPQASDIKLVKTRIVDELLNTPMDDQQIETLISTQKDDGTWPGIDYSDVSRTGFEHRIHSANMVTLAKAYRNPSSKYHGRSKPMKTLQRALRNWVEQDYFCDNWWHNQIGTPNNLVAVLLLVGDELPQDLVEMTQPIINRATIEAGGARPGGDRIKIASIQAKNQLFLGDDPTFEKVIHVIETEIKYVDWIGAWYGYGFRETIGGFANRSAGGRGIQYDNSFHHRADGVNNTLSYGLGYADAFVEWAVYVTGTKYAFSDEQLERLVDYFLDGICKTAVYGKYPDPGAKNRSISREHTLHAYNSKTADKLLLTTEYRRDEIQEIADIRSKNAKPTTSHATFYWHSEHFSFQRPDFFTSVRLYSTRNYNMEQPYNSEGLLNHHRGDGTNHISRTGDEYYDIAPVFDFQKIPGTTILQKPSLPPPDQIQKLGLTDFVGAVTDGKYGAVGFDFKSPHDPLVARKAWFFFDQEYVCLGAGISTRKDLPVVTTLNQCLLRDQVVVSVNDQRNEISRGENRYENVDWVLQDGIGYVFTSPATVHIKNDTATGSWYTINKQTDSPKGVVSLDVFKLWLDHGKAPSEETYQYIVVPATSLEMLEAGHSKKNITILSNTPELQAVHHKQLNMIQAVFYKAGEIALTNNLTLRAANPGIIVVKMKEGEVHRISVADPNRELGQMGFSISARIDSKHESFNSFWDEGKKVSQVLVDLPQGQFAGSSVVINCNQHP